MAFKVPYHQIPALGAAERQVMRNFHEVERALSAAPTNGFDATVIGGATSNPAQRVFATVHEAAIYLDSIGLTNVRISVTGTVTEASASTVAADVPATVILIGQRGAVWNLNNLASTWTKLTLQGIEFRAGTAHATPALLASTSVTTIDCDLPAAFAPDPTQIGFTDVAWFAYRTNIGGYVSAGLGYFFECLFDAGIHTFSGGYTQLADCRRAQVNSGVTWTFSGAYVAIDMMNDNGIPFGNTLTINVTTARFLHAQWRQAGNAASTSQNPCYVTLNISSSNLRSCVILGSWLGALTVPASVSPATINAHFGTADITGPANINLTVGAEGFTNTGRTILRGAGIVGTVVTSFTSTTFTAVTGVGLVGSGISVVPHRVSGAAGSSKGLDLDAASSRNVIFYPKVATAASIFGVSYTDAGSLNVVIDENGIPAAGLPSTIVYDGDTAGGDLSGAFPSPSVVDDSHAHSGLTVALDLDDLGDVDLTGLADGDGIFYDQGSGLWVPGAGGGGGGGSLATLSDVSLTSLAGGDILLYDGVSDWINEPISTTPYVKVSNPGAPQALANNTDVTLLWNTDDSDDFGMHDTSSDTERLVADRDGIWVVWIVGGFTANSSGGRRITIRKNAGATIVGRTAVGPSGGSLASTPPLAVVLPLSAGDYVYAEALQDSGGALNTSTGSMQFGMACIGAITFSGGGGGDITTDPAWASKGQIIVATGNDAAAVLSPGDDGKVPIALATETAGLVYGRPKGLDFYLEPGHATMDHMLASTAITQPVSGTAVLVAIPLPKGLVVTNISFLRGTGLTGPTHSWFSLCDNAYGTLRSTGDLTSTAWTANTVRTAALSTPFTTTYEGLYYLACVTTSSGAVGSLIGSASVATTATSTITPLRTVTGNTGLTTPVADGTNLATAPTARTSLVYAYIT